MRLSTSTILSVVSDVEPDSLFGSYSHSLAGRKGKGPECNHRAFSRHRGELHASTKHSSIWEYSKGPICLSSPFDVSTDNTVCHPHSMRLQGHRSTPQSMPHALF